MTDKQRPTMFICLLALLGIKFQYARADCYPGDIRYTELVQNMYHGVTSDSIALEAHLPPTLTRGDLCTILVDRHNSHTNPGQTNTNAVFLGTSIPITNA